MNIKQQIQKLNLPELSMTKGELIIKENDLNHSIFILVKGKLEVSANSEVIAYIEDPYSIVGELSVLLSTSSMATVKCLTDSIFLKIDYADVFIEEYPLINYAIAKSLAERIRNANELINELQDQLDITRQHPIRQAILRKLNIH